MGRPKGGKNQRRSCQEKEQLIKEYYQSALGYKDYAKSKGISYSLFYSWIKKYEEEGMEGLRHKSRKVTAKQMYEEENLKLKLIIAEQQIQILKLQEKLNQIES